MTVSSNLSRRYFLPAALTAAAGALTLRAQKRPPRIVLRSSWQTINIGDIGHTPGVLALLERHLPHAEVVLWPMDVRNGVEQILRRRFPKLTITRDEATVRGCDFLLHGSGPYLTAHKDVAEWRKLTGKPYGVYGITMAPAGDPALRIMQNNGLDEYTKELLDGASFVFLRDGVSLQVAKNAGVRSPVVEFGPDGAFAADVRNDASALAFLKRNELEEGRFICCLPNLRNAPYWRVKPGYRLDEAKHKRNEEMKERDHAPLRAGIVKIVREAGLKVLVCPEDATQMTTGKELLIDPLPDDVKTRVVWRENFWLTDEALSVYVRSAGLLSLEMHSPIMAVGNGIPAVVCRFAEQSSKGFMWRDIGLGDWLFDLDREDDVRRVAATAFDMVANPAASKARVAKAREFVRSREKRAMEVLARAVSSL
jgi:polysaccharide pyruvyl transferase WcaK-like protein